MSNKILISLIFAGVLATPPARALECKYVDIQIAPGYELKYRPLCFGPYMGELFYSERKSDKVQLHLHSVDPQAKENKTVEELVRSRSIRCHADGSEGVLFVPETSVKVEKIKLGAKEAKLTTGEILVALDFKKTKVKATGRSCTRVFVPFQYQEKTTLVLEFELPWVPDRNFNLEELQKSVLKIEAL